LRPNTLSHGQRIRRTIARTGLKDDCAKMVERRDRYDEMR
jgi:hypothetical protein